MRRRNTLVVHVDINSAQTQVSRGMSKRLIISLVQLHKIRIHHKKVSVVFNALIFLWGGAPLDIDHFNDFANYRGLDTYRI